ncbi:methionyl-tRNA formyltransferase [Marinimicrobium sp. ABcell2]|uniref:methionyl-tRNA formyltransferase n=1 Tax=Marinimicrobium sp. ABcell2 TaxID=3069751 RepID=UPI0027B8658A|nr:methionyl-tRNA formyltransferase [Marinimicrobium sp. ABcell2]MDQ2077067.1 methionyl-tRNA formyltransferase [Marinimicrobium sp. ABcell2]
MTQATAQGLRIVFAGTPDFAARQLQALLASEHQVIAAYTQPDRPAGRGKKLTASPVKQLAQAQQILVYQPATLKTQEAQAQLAALEADVMVVVAYGLILPQAVLDIPRLGCINIHASLLPRWRGAAPIQRAIQAGDTVSGVTIMQMDAGLDTGDMLVKAQCPIEPEDSAGDLHDRLAELGGPATLETLRQLQAGTATPEVQDDSESCYAPKISKAEAALDWRRPAPELARQVRAFNPFPIAFMRTGEQEQPIRVWAAHALDSQSTAESGTVIAAAPTGLDIACGEGVLRLETLQLPGKKAMSVADLLRGHPGSFSPGQTLALPQ